MAVLLDEPFDLEQSLAHGAAPSVPARTDAPLEPAGDAYLGDGGCMQLASALARRYPTLKIKALYSGPNGDGLEHAVAYDPRTGAAHDARGTFRSTTAAFRDFGQAGTCARRDAPPDIAPDPDADAYVERHWGARENGGRRLRALLPAYSADPAELDALDATRSPPPTRGLDGLEEALLQLLEAVFDEAAHPRWPEGAEDPIDHHHIGGEFMRIGERFFKDGHQWEIEHVAKGHIIAHEASGKFANAETRVFTPTQVADGTNRIKDAVPAPIPVLKAGQGASYDEVPNVSVVPAGAEHDHDPSIKLPTGSPLSEEEWQRFGKADQLLYTALAERFGPWKQGFARNELPKVMKQYSQAAQKAVRDAFHHQYSHGYGKAAGDYLSLQEVFDHQPPDSARKIYREGRELQGDIEEVNAWELYNRLHAPDVSLFHGGSGGTHNTKIVNGTGALKPGYSTSWAHSKASGWGSSVTAFSLAARHVLLASDVSQPPGSSSYMGEAEFSTGDRLLLNPSIAHNYNAGGMDAGLSKWVSTNFSYGAGAMQPGGLVQAMIEHMKGGKALPIPPPPPNVQLDYKGAEKPALPAPDIISQAVELAQTAHYAGGEDADTALKPISQLNLKPGDLIEGHTVGKRYMVISAPNTPTGLAYMKLDGSNAIFNFSSTSTERRKLDKSVTMPPPKAAEELPAFNPEHWVQAGELQPLGKMDEGDKVQLEGDYYEITGHAGSQTLLKSLTTGQTGHANSGAVTAALGPKPGYEEEYTPIVGKPVLVSDIKGTNLIADVLSTSDKAAQVQLPDGTKKVVSTAFLSNAPKLPAITPQKGDIFEKDGVKHVITNVQKNGSVSARPVIPGQPAQKVQKFDPGEELTNLFRPGDYEHGEKQKLKDMAPGTIVSGSPKTIHPYMVLGSSGGKTHLKNLETGEISHASQNLSKYVPLQPKGMKVPEPAPEEPPAGVPSAAPEGFTANGDAGKMLSLGELGPGDKFIHGNQAWTVLYKPDPDTGQITAMDPDGATQGFPPTFVPDAYQKAAAAEPLPADSPLKKAIADYETGIAHKGLPESDLGGKYGAWEVKNVLGASPASGGTGLFYEDQMVAFKHANGTHYVTDQPDMHPAVSSVVAQIKADHPDAEVTAQDTLNAIPHIEHMTAAQTDAHGTPLQIGDKVQWGGVPGYTYQGVHPDNPDYAYLSAADDAPGAPPIIATTSEIVKGPKATDEPTVGDTAMPLHSAMQPNVGGLSVAELPTGAVFATKASGIPGFFHHKVMGPDKGGWAGVPIENDQHAVGSVIPSHIWYPPDTSLPGGGEPSKASTPAAVGPGIHPATMVKKGHHMKIKLDGKGAEYEVLETPKPGDKTIKIQVIKKSGEPGIVYDWNHKNHDVLITKEPPVPAAEEMPPSDGKTLGELVGDASVSGAKGDKFAHEGHTWQVVSATKFNVYAQNLDTGEVTPLPKSTVPTSYEKVSPPAQTDMNGVELKAGDTVTVKGVPGFTYQGPEPGGEQFFGSVITPQGYGPTHASLSDIEKPAVVQTDANGATLVKGDPVNWGLTPGFTYDGPHPSDPDTAYVVNPQGTTVPVPVNELSTPGFGAPPSAPIPAGAPKTLGDLNVGDKYQLGVGGYEWEVTGKGPDGVSVKGPDGVDYTVPANQPFDVPPTVTYKAPPPVTVPGEPPPITHMPIQPYLWHKGTGTKTYDPISGLKPGEQFSDKSGATHTVVKQNLPSASDPIGSTTVQGPDGSTFDVPHKTVNNKGKTIPTRINKLSTTAPVPETAPPAPAPDAAADAKDAASNFLEGAGHDFSDIGIIHNVAQANFQSDKYPSSWSDGVKWGQSYADAYVEHFGEDPGTIDMGNSLFDTVKSSVAPSAPSAKPTPYSDLQVGDLMNLDASGEPKFKVTADLGDQWELTSLAGGDVSYVNKGATGAIPNVVGHEPLTPLTSEQNAAVEALRSGNKMTSGPWHTDIVGPPQHAMMVLSYGHGDAAIPVAYSDEDGIVHVTPVHYESEINDVVDQIKALEPSHVVADSQLDLDGEIGQASAPVGELANLKAEAPTGWLITPSEYGGYHVTNPQGVTYHSLPYGEAHNWIANGIAPFQPPAETPPPEPSLPSPVDDEHFKAMQAGEQWLTGHGVSLGTASQVHYQAKDYKQNQYPGWTWGEAYAAAAQNAGEFSPDELGALKSRIDGPPTPEPTEPPLIAKLPAPATGPDAGIPDYTDDLHQGADLHITGGAGGTTGAQLATHTTTGEKWLIKDYGGNENRVATELLANSIYRTMGHNAAEAGILKDPVGEAALTYPLKEGTPAKFSTKYGAGDEAKMRALGDGYMTDALLANYDFVGLDDDNVLWNGNEPTRIDQGGTFEYRAQGASKPFSEVPTEVASMLTQGQGKRGVLVSEPSLRQQAQDIGNTLTDQKIDELVDAAPFTDEQMRERYRKNLKARVQWMREFGDGGHSDMLEGVKLAPEPEPAPAPEPEPEPSSTSDALAHEAAHQWLTELGVPQDQIPAIHSDAKAYHDDPNGGAYGNWPVAYSWAAYDNAVSQPYHMQIMDPINAALAREPTAPTEPPAAPAAPAEPAVPQLESNNHYDSIASLGLGVGDHYAASGGTWRITQDYGTSPYAVEAVNVKTGEHDVVGKGMVPALYAKTTSQAPAPKTEAHKQAYAAAEQWLGEQGTPPEMKATIHQAADDYFHDASSPTHGDWPLAYSYATGDHKSANSSLQQQMFMQDIQKAVQQGLAPPAPAPPPPPPPSKAPNISDMPIQPYLWHKGSGTKTYASLSTLKVNAEFTDKSGAKFKVISSEAGVTVAEQIDPPGGQIAISHTFTKPNGQVSPTRVNAL